MCERQCAATCIGPLRLRVVPISIFIRFAAAFACSFWRGTDPPSAFVIDEVLEQFDTRGARLTKFQAGNIVSRLGERPGEGPRTKGPRIVFGATSRFPNCGFLVIAAAFLNFAVAFFGFATSFAMGQKSNKNKHAMTKRLRITTPLVNGHKFPPEPVWKSAPWA